MDGAAGPGRAVRAVRAVTALSRLRVVLSLDQLAAYADVPMQTLDDGLSTGPVADGRIERVVQGSYVGYRHPDAAWTTLPSRLAAASAGIEFARWFADWLDEVGPERRKAAHATAKAVSAAARAAGKTALADRIESVYSRRKRREAEAPFPLPNPPPMPTARAVSRLSTRTTAGILIGTAVLLTGAVAGVAALSETPAIAGGVQARSIGGASPNGIATDGIQASSSGSGPPGLAAAPSSSAASSGGPATTRPSSSATSSASLGTSSSAGANGTSPVQVDYVSSAAGSTSSGSSGGSSTTSGGNSGSGGSSTSPTTDPATTASSTTASAPTTSAAPTTSIATTASSDPVATATTPSSGDSTTGCINLLGLISVCL